MKKIFLSVAMSALFLIGSLFMVSMAPPPPDNTICAKIAKEFAAELEELGISKGQFISFCAVCLNKSQSQGNQAVCACKFAALIDEIEGNENGETFGKCVSSFNEGTPE